MKPLPQLHAIAPQVDAPVVSIAEEQPEYLTVYGGLVTHPGYSAPVGYNTVLLAFRPDPEHREAIANGADIYVSLLTFGQPMQAIMVLVGKESAAAVFNVAIAR